MSGSQKSAALFIYLACTTLLKSSPIKDKR